MYIKMYRGHLILPTACEKKSVHVYEVYVVNPNFSFWVKSSAFWENYGPFYDLLDWIKFRTIVHCRVCDRARVLFYF